MFLAFNWYMTWLCCMKIWTCVTLYINVQNHNMYPVDFPHKHLHMLYLLLRYHIIHITELIFILLYIVFGYSSQYDLHNYCELPFIACMKFMHAPRWIHRTHQVAYVMPKIYTRYIVNWLFYSLHALLHVYTCTS